MLTAKQIRGQKGEELAVSYLIHKGYSIIQRNYRSGKSEIDIICKKDALLIFVEVRTRISISYGYPEQTISKPKIRSIIKGAESYIFKTNWEGEIRFDIIAILLFDPVEIEHFEDVFF